MRGSWRPSWPRCRRNRPTDFPPPAPARCSRAARGATSSCAPLDSRAACSGSSTRRRRRRASRSSAALRCARSRPPRAAARSSTMDARSAPRARARHAGGGHARLVRETKPALAQALSTIATVSIDSLGVVSSRARSAWIRLLRLPGPGRRRLLLLRRPGNPFPRPALRRLRLRLPRRPHPRGAAGARVRNPACQPADFLHLAEKQLTLRRGARAPAASVAIDRALRGAPLALTENYFEGLAIEDACSDPTPSGTDR